MRPPPHRNVAVNLYRACLRILSIDAYRRRASRDVLETLEISSRLSSRFIASWKTASRVFERLWNERIYRRVSILSLEAATCAVVILVLRDRRVSERHRDALTKSRAENIHEGARGREKTRERERERERGRRKEWGKRQLVAPGKGKRKSFAA